MKAIWKVIRKIATLIWAKGGGFKNKFLKPWWFSSSDPKRVKVPYVAGSFILAILILAMMHELSYQVLRFITWKSFITFGRLADAAKVKPDFIPLISRCLGIFTVLIGIYTVRRNRQSRLANISHASINDEERL